MVELEPGPDVVVSGFSVLVTGPLGSMTIKKGYPVMGSPEPSGFGTVKNGSGTGITWNGNPLVPASELFRSGVTIIGCPVGLLGSGIIRKG